MAEIDWDKGQMTPPASAAPDWESGTMAPPSNKGFMSDVGTALKQGVQQLPGAVTGLVDIPLGLAGMNRPASRAAERLGEVTGFQPGKWAEQTAQQYTPETQTSRAEIDKVWDDPNAGALDVAGAYLRNPRATALNVVQSVPSIVAGGVAGRVAGLAGLASAPARAALGEGAVMAGQQMDQISDDVDAQKAALASLGTGVAGAAAGAVSGGVAARMGVRDVDTALSGGAAAQAARAPGIAGRVAGGAAQEAAEEASQSAVEQGAQNWAEDRPLTEGMARNVVEGSLAGGVMGAGAGAVPPSRRMGLDPNAGPLSAAAATAVDSGATLALPAPTVTVDGEGTARTAEQRQADRDDAGPVETGAMGQGRNSEQVPAPAPFPAPEQQPALEYSAPPALGYDTAPTDTLIADADGTVRQETRAEAVNRQQVQGEQQVGEDAEAQRRVDLGMPPLTPVEQVRPGPARGETLELGADGVARPVDLLPEPTNRIRAGRAAREAGPGHEPVRVEGGWNVRRIEGAADGATGEPGGLAAGDGAGQRADAGRGLGDAGRPQLGGPEEGVRSAAGNTVAPGQGDLALRAGGPDAAVARPAPAGRVPGLPVPEPAGAGNVANAAARGTASPVAEAQDVPARPALPAPATPLDQAAHAAATSPTNDLPEPSQAQKEAGNYRKGRLKLHGLDISIENPRGSTRSGTDPGGRPWSVDMPAHYGYVRRTTGADGDQVDVYIGEHPDSQRVFVVDQRDADTGKFDEHKVIMGARNALEARRLYNAGFSDGRGRERMGAVTTMSVDEFKTWLKGDTTSPAAELQRSIAGDLERLYQQDVKADIKVRRGLAPAPVAGPSGAKQSPLRSFLRQAGIDPSLAADVTGERGLRANQRLPGTFRKGGKQLDELVTLARERGFLSDSDVESSGDTGGTRRLVELIQAELRGERAVPVDAADDVASDRLAARATADLQAQADAIGFDTAGLSDDQVSDSLRRIERRRSQARQRSQQFDLQAEVADERLALQMAEVDLPEDTMDALLASGNNATVEDAMRALGFTEQEIRHATADTAEVASESREGGGRPAEAAAGAARSSDRPRQGTEREEGLTSPSRADIEAQQDRAASAERAQTQTQQDHDRRARADAERGEFKLTGTDRPADVGAAGGQIDLLSRRSGPAADTSRTALKHRREIEQTITATTSVWKNPPRVVVASHPRDSSVHPRVREHYSQPGAIVPNGSYYGGTVYLFTDYLQDPAEARRVLFHEALGHAGLRGFFGPALNGVLDQVATARADLVRAKAEEYGFDIGNQRQRRMAAEEVLAELAEQNPQLLLVRRAVAAIRTWLRENIPALRGLALSDAEIVRNFLLPARGFIERGPAAERVPSSAVPASARAISAAVSAVPDTEKARFLQGDAILDLPGGQAPQGYPALRAWATKLFEDVGGKVTHPVLGDVLLDLRSVRDSMAHMMNPFKAEAFAAVPEVLRKGVVVLSATEGIEDSFYVSAPVRIKGADDIVTVLVRRNPKTQRMYLHSVATKEYLLTRLDSRATAGAAPHTGEARSGDASIVTGAQEMAGLLNPRVSGTDTARRNVERSGSSNSGDPKEAPQKARDSGADTANAASGRTGKVTSGEVASVLRRLLSMKLDGPDADAPMASKAAAGTAMGTMTPTQEAAWKRVAQLRQVPTLKERFDTLRANLGTKLRAGILDQFAPIKEVSQEAYVQARLSKGSDGTMEAALLYGKPFLRDGAADVDVKDGGFAQVLASLKGEHDRFLMWVAAQRAERLQAEGKENLFTSQDIGALKTLNAGRYDDGTARTPVYAKALRDLNAFNDSVLAMAEESGLIDPEARALFKDQPYVPFYRVMEEGDMRGPKFSSGLVNQQAFKKLKGGNQQLNADLLENMLMNWSHLYSAAARNRAAQATMDAADRLAIAHQVPEGTKGAVRVMRNGTAQHWAVEDPHLLEAITALNYAPSPLMKPLAVMKNILTYTVTVNPTFKIRNLIRDSLSAISQADLSYNPLKNVADGWKATAADSQIYASMLASGGTIRFGTQESSTRLRDQVEKLGGQVLDKDGWRKLADQVRTAWGAYEEFGDRVENVNRAALYEQLVKKGHSHAEAAFMSRDLMDFSMSGAWPLVRFLGQTVPFFNARVQGLYKLGRAAAEDPRRFGTMAAAVSLASLGLMAAYQDDDDWKKREDWDRDAYWWFKVGGTAFRIPKPFELGAIGTIAERSAELMLSDEMTGKRFGQRISDMVFGTFAMDPTPQIIKPLLDVYANKDSFTGRAIEGAADERLRPQDRAGERTTEVARFLGQLGLPDPVQLAKGEYSALSPKQVDFLLRGYFGWVGVTAAQLGDRALRPLMDRGERPAMELRDAFLAGNFMESLPSGSSRYVTQLYDRARDVDQAYASYRDALKRGDTERAAAIREGEGSSLQARRAVHNAQQQLAKINQQARMVEASRTLSAEEKRLRLDEIEERRDRVARTASVQ